MCGKRLRGQRRQITQRMAKTPSALWIPQLFPVDRFGKALPVPMPGAKEGVKEEVAGDTLPQSTSGDEEEDDDDEEEEAEADDGTVAVAGLQLDGDTLTREDEQDIGGVQSTPADANSQYVFPDRDPFGFDGPWVQPTPPPSVSASSTSPPPSVSAIAAPASRAPPAAAPVLPPPQVFPS